MLSRAKELSYAIAAAIRSGPVSAVEALAAHLAQIDRRLLALNALVTLKAEHRPKTGHGRRPRPWHTLQAPSTSRRSRKAAGAPAAGFL